MNTRKEVVSGVFGKEEKGILLVKKRDVWVLPGGKVEGKESYKNCLLRKIKEELPDLTVHNLSLIEKKFTGITPHSEKPVKTYVFTGKTIGSLETNHEMNEAKWATIPTDLILSEVTSQIIGHFYCNGFLKRRVK